MLHAFRLLSPARRLFPLGVVLALTMCLGACESLGGKSAPADPAAAAMAAASERSRQDRLVALNDGRSFGDPVESAKIHTELAFGYFQRGQMAVALQEVEVALRSKADYYQAYNVMGLIQMDLGQNPKSEEAFRKALSIAPADSDVLNNYGWFLCQTRREREAIPQFMAALKNPLYSTPAKPYLNAGICSQRIGDDTAAEDYFRRAFSLDPGNAAAMLRLGELYYRRDDLTKARFYADRLNKNYDPSPPSLWLALRIERKAGNRASESSFAAQLRRRYPDSPEGIKLQQGQFE